MTFTLKQVETFRTVYETESVTAEARRLGVSPATVSATLAALEATIELRLFERLRQRIGCIHAYSGASVSDTIARFRQLVRAQRAQRIARSGV